MLELKMEQALILHYRYDTFSLKSLYVEQLKLGHVFYADNFF